MRLDRGMYTIPVWWGLLFTGLKTILLPHNEYTYFHEVEWPEWFEYSLAVPFTIAAAALLFASAIGDPKFMPKVKQRTILITEFIALAVIVLAIGIDAIAKDEPLFHLLTMGGGFGAIIQIGSLRFMAHCLVELKKLKEAP